MPQARARACLADLASSARRLATRPAWADIARELAPLGLVAAIAPWLVVCLRHYATGTAWRDVSMYTYPAWCILHGERLYDTIAVPDGPLAILIHLPMLVLSGLHEDAWRRFDLGFHVFVGALLGMLVVRRAPGLGAAAAIARRASWAIVGAALWLTQLLSFHFGATLQREAYYVGIGMLGVVIVYASAWQPRRLAAWMIGGGALLAGLPFWGKQTAGLYAAFAVMTALALPSTPDRPLRWRMRWAGMGLGASVLLVLAFVAAVGSLRGMWLWYFRYNVEYYRFHDIEEPLNILSASFAQGEYNIAAISLVVGLAAIAMGLLPARCLAFATAPALECASAVGQMRGWTYHFIPAEFCAAVFFLVALGHGWRDVRRTGRVSQAERVATTVVAFLFVGWWSLGLVMSSTWLKASESHVDDPSATQPIAAARVLAEHTRPGDRVFHFGDDPAVTLFAERLPATPYEVAWMRDLVKHVPLAGPLKITAAQEAGVRALERRFQQDDCARLLANPPPAMVFHDGAVGYGSGIIQVVYGYCPALRSIVDKRYHRVQVGPYHLFFRDDRP
ncbi:MAG: hypothetical protein ACRELB_19385 [Polyangiaceae bacterium]